MRKIDEQVAPEDTKEAAWSQLRQINPYTPICNHSPLLPLNTPCAFFFNVLFTVPLSSLMIFPLPKIPYFSFFSIEILLFL